MILKVRSVKSLANSTVLTLEDGSEVKLRPYIYVRDGDSLEFLPSIDHFTHVSKIFIDRATGKEKSVIINPPYCVKDTIYLEPHKFEVTFRERLNAKDWENVKELEQFHYRGKGLNKLVGRRTVLLAEIEGYGIVGFGVLAATMAATRPRFKLLNTNFKEQMRTGLINQLVRIPRIVIHPEFRGMNLGVLMAKNLIKYAATYWDINHYKPIMIEVVAAMIEYHKFFQKAGFIEAGNTLGYQNISIKPKYGSGTFEQRKNHKTYDFIQNQKSKPYLVYPLNDEIEKKIKVAKLNSISSLTTTPLPKLPTLTQPIVFQDVSVKFRVKNGSTDRTEIVKEAFGIDSEHAFSRIFQDLSLRIDPGDVVLITGASGSGKSTIMRLLITEPAILEEELELNGSISNQHIHNTAILDTTSVSDLPLIDQIKIGGDIKDAIKLLNAVGLSEAHLYIKRSNQISDGQRYRFAVAKLCDSNKPLWIADEFASTLNPEMAAIVAKGLRKMAYTHGATLVLAAPHIHNFVGSLLPNKIIKLRWGAKPAVYSLKLDKWTQKKDLFSLTIINNGSQTLTNIKVGFIHVNGHFVAQEKFDSLVPKGKITASIKSHNKEIIAVGIKTLEEIGEVLFIQH